ncbi:nucleotidyltransferase domain-containing protein [Methanocalculus sp.]|uniref:nucleotidyltransferase domain-containing protein n=1 Tax=Methanocalculus sp. TaxID=2004547 RepID=UPI0026378D91|nr:nucleotidyltransferase domain-containing protein [Methanocalculus sp.]MDG6249869.1 hypothetical protein [Methanocalculus sp.]
MIWIVEVYHSPECSQIANKMFLVREQNDHIVLSGLFKSEERILVLRYVGLRASVTVQAVADATGRSKGFVSQYLNMLVDEELLTRDHRAFIREDSVYWRSIKRLLNLDLLRPHVTLPAWAEGIGIYGSWAEGTNTTESDLDVWILVSRYDPDLEIRAAELDQEIAQYAGCEVNSLLLTPDKLCHLKEHDQPFYTSLKRGFLTLHGEDLEFA